MLLRLCTAILVLLGVTSVAGAAGKQALTGKAVYTTACAECHKDGKNGEPRSGDLQAWGKRAEKGFDKLAEHAVSGFGKMPAHGGKAQLSDLEISRGIAYMVTGGLAADPGKPYSTRRVATADAVVRVHCAPCHTSGKDGAPKPQVFADWKARVQNGMDSLVASAVAGHNKMPSRAGFAGLSDEDVKGAVIYMMVPAAR